MYVVDKSLRTAHKDEVPPQQIIDILILTERFIFAELEVGIMAKIRVRSQLCSGKISFLRKKNLYDPYSHGLNHLVRWIAGKPQSEDWRRILWSEFFADLLQRRHPRHCQVAVLQQHPRAVLFGLVYHASSNWTLVNINITKYIQGGQKISKNHAFYVCLWLCDTQVWVSPIIHALEPTLSLNLLSSTHWQTNILETRTSGESRSLPRQIWSKSRWLSKFNWNFLYQSYISDIIFMRIRAVFQEISAELGKNTLSTMSKNASRVFLDLDPEADDFQI